VPFRVSLGFVLPVIGSSGHGGRGNEKKKKHVGTGGLEKRRDSTQDLRKWPDLGKKRTKMCPRQGDNQSSE